MVDRKVTTSVIGGALVTILLGVLALAGVEVSAEVSAAAVTLVTLAVGTLVPNTSGLIVTVKGQAQTVGAASVAVLAYVLTATSGLEVGQVVAAAVTTLVAAGIAYAKRETRSA